MGCIFNLIRNIFAFIGLITVIVAVVIGLLINSFGQPSAIEEGMRDIEITADAADRFDLNWEEFTTGLPGVINTLRLTEEEFSSKVTLMAGELGIPVDVKKIWVNFEPGSVNLTIAIVGNIFGLDVHIAAQGIIDIVENPDGTKVLKYKIIDLSLPEQLKTIIEENISERFDLDFERGVWHEYELPTDWDLELTDISVELVDGKYTLVIGGKVIEGTVPTE